ISSADSSTPFQAKAVTAPKRWTARRQARVAGWLAPPEAVQVAPSQRQVAPSKMTRPEGAVAASARVRRVGDWAGWARAGAAAKTAAAMSRARMGRFLR